MIETEAAWVPDRLLRFVKVRYRVGLGKTMIYAMIVEGRFPMPYKMTPAATRWSEREVEAWISVVTGGVSNPT
ncbi:helix-turn-helix transcriptional regulator [Sphingobium sp. YR768]|uniref:helix-turn-helix transcriptional regulator n=1 Tax=Sphingobium sp. YR768 TaxID=1884365 RepID=UPI0008B8431E|nr:AlpA family phage regulatory protein [Sphingobium sp. YR768]SER82026.1 transcriptional regulator, AlpA family [Sphingobium sp. YR768]